MFEFESSGKNIQQAVENGAKELGINPADVDIKVLDAGGVFKKAKVLLICPDELCKDNVKIQKFIKLREVESRAREEVMRENLENHASKPHMFSHSKSEDVEQVAETQPAQQDIQAGLEKAEVKELEAETEEIKVEPKLVSNVNELKEFLSGMLKNLDVDIVTRESDTEIVFELCGVDSEQLVDKKGKTISAMQYLVSVYNRLLDRHSKRVHLDVDGFRGKRKDTIESFANRMCRKAIEGKTQIKLDPMNAYERKIVHSVVIKYPELQSESFGEEPHRYMVISYKD